jgi:hypothetical protein
MFRVGFVDSLMSLLHLFIYGLFSNAVNSSEDIALSARMINEQ